MMSIEEFYRLLTATMDNHKGKIIVEEDKMTSLIQKRKLLMAIRTLQNFLHNLLGLGHNIFLVTIFIVNRCIFST